MKITLDPRKIPFNLDYTLQCGQVFRWQKHDTWWRSVVAGKAIKIRQMDNLLEFNGANADFIEKYFRLDDPLPLITSRISKDNHIRSAVQTFHGLRLIRQDPWECLISYICATFNNIPRIKKMISNLAQKFGNKRSSEGYLLYTFPDPESLANAGLKALTACNLGFRAKMILETAKMMDKKIIRLADLEKVDYEVARKELLKLPGVGDKVADCVLLFSLNKLDAFPVDVWIKKSVLKHYGAYFDDFFVRRTLEKKSLTKGEYKRIGTFAREYFDEYAGYAQQYLYHFEREICDAV